MLIQSASASDIDALADLLGILFLQELEFAPSKELQKRSLEKIISNPQIGHIICAKLPTQTQALSEPLNSLDQDESLSLIGMVSILFSESTALGARVAILEDMIVHPKFRAQGVGSKLLNGAIAFSKQSGCKRITLLTDKTNTNAQSFYRAHGFTQSSMTTMRVLI